MCADVRGSLCARFGGWISVVKNNRRRLAVKLGWTADWMNCCVACWAGNNAHIRMGEEDA